MGRVVAGSDLKVAPALREELPLLLWLVQMGMVLFWVYDASPGRTRTRQLVRQAVPILDKLLRATRIPGVRGIADDVVVLVGRWCRGRDSLAQYQPRRSLCAQAPSGLP